MIIPFNADLFRCGIFAISRDGRLANFSAYFPEDDQEHPTQYPLYAKIEGQTKTHSWTLKGIFFTKPYNGFDLISLDLPDFLFADGFNVVDFMAGKPAKLGSDIFTFRSISPEETYPILCDVKRPDNTFTYRISLSGKDCLQMQLKTEEQPKMTNKKPFDLEKFKAGEPAYFWDSVEFEAKFVGIFPYQSSPKISIQSKTGELFRINADGEMAERYIRLYMKPKKVTKWANIYGYKGKFELGDAYTSEKEATEQINYNPNFVKTIFFGVEE